MARRGFAAPKTALHGTPLAAILLRSFLPLTSFVTIGFFVVKYVGNCCFRFLFLAPFLVILVCLVVKSVGGRQAA